MATARPLSVTEEALAAGTHTVACEPTGTLTLSAKLVPERVQLELTGPSGVASLPDAEVRSPTALGSIWTVRNPGDVAWIPATPENSQSSTVPMNAWSRERAVLHEESSHASHMVVAPHCRNHWPQPGAVGLVATR